MVSTPSWGKLLPSNCQGIVTRRNLVFVCLYSALPKRCPICCEIFDPLGIVRLEGGGYISEYELAFPETAWDVGYLTHLCFHLHLIKPIKAEWTLKVKGETVLDHVVVWFSRAVLQVKTSQSPFALWDLAGKALLTPIRKEAERQYKCFIEWKYQKYIRY